MSFYNCLIISLLALFLGGCSGLEKSESKKQRQVNLVVEPLQRKEGDAFFEIQEPQLADRKEVYPWQQKYIGKLPRITKEFFRCKGSPLSPPLRVESESKEITYQIDCGGMERHSLPVRQGEEFIYPILIELLNAVQQKTGKRVIITSGHRCPTHNMYVEPTKKNRVSKHLMGAEVDFYVEGMEYDPLSVVAAIEEFYQEDTQFQSLKQEGNVWRNKEIVITCHKATERRNGDNQHSYPYLTIELKYDRHGRKPVHFSWHLGYNAFHRNG